MHQICHESSIQNGELSKHDLSAEIEHLWICSWLKHDYYRNKQSQKLYIVLFFYQWIKLQQKYYWLSEHDSSEENLHLKSYWSFSAAKKHFGIGKLIWNSFKLLKCSDYAISHISTQMFKPWFIAEYVSSTTAYIFNFFMAHIWVINKFVPFNSNLVV